MNIWGMRTRRHLTTAGALIACIPVLVACSSAPQPAPSTSASVGVPMAVAPLTGILLPEASLAHSSLAAKIDNHEEARPQWGLNQTDIVFEELVEGGLTRYVAVWHSQLPTIIGPVRSIRPMDPDIITPFLGIVAYSGGQSQFVEMMRETPVYNAIHGQADTEEFMYRDETRDAPHNVAVKAPELVAAHADIPAPQKMFSFATHGVDPVWWGAKPATQIDVSFSDSRYPSWTYDALSNTYLRSQESSTADFDSAGYRIHATNVIVMMMNVDFDTYGYVPKTLMVDSGQAWISSGGVTQEVTWSKKDRESPIVYKDAAGRIVPIAPGNTWIEMPPVDGGAVAFH